jgi:hypothetical protein
MIGAITAGLFNPTVPPKPVLTGGTLTSDATYYYRTFTANDTLGVTAGPISCDILIVAGGASGARDGGGGGAGGYLPKTGQSIATGSYSVVIGQGGASVSSGNVRGNSGTDSSINSLVATGGGGGGDDQSATIQTGLSGGSGGGGGTPATLGTAAGGAGNTPSTSPSQGYAGGQGQNGIPSYNLGGGGGGAGGVGGNAIPAGNNNVRATRGASVTTSSYGTSSVSYCGGGLGSGDATSNATLTANTGFGGDAGYYNSGYYPSTAGASGVVIVKYLKADV